MKYKLLILFLSFLQLPYLFCQSGSVEGTVKQSNGEVIPFANVYLSNSSIGASTDINGKFKIEHIPVGEQLITAQFIGFEKQIIKVRVKENQSTSLHFTLKQSKYELSEVVISGTMKKMSRKDSPVPVEVYSSSFFENNKSNSVFEALDNINGVRPQVNCSVCNTGDIHINGLEGPYTMVLIDGMPIVSGLSTVYGLSGIPTSLIERVEIVKGPASSLYGSEAVGGLINVITKKPSNSALFSAEVYATSWQEVNTDIASKFNIGEKVTSLLGVNYFNYSNPIDHNQDGFTDLTLQDRISIFNKLSIDRKDNREFNIGMRYVYEDRWGGDMKWNPEFRGGDSIYGESIYTNRWEIFGNYQLPFESENFNLQFSANQHLQNSFYGTDSYNADQRIGFTQLTWDKKIFATHDFLFGAGYRYSFYNDNTAATLKSDSSGHRASITHLPGVFIQDQIILNEFNTLLLGLRYDYNNIHGNIFSPRINYKWNSANDKTQLRLSAGNGFRVANIFTEDHAALTGAREVVFKEKLKPEKSYNVNLNAVQRFYTKNETFISLDASLFYTLFSNQIIPDYESNKNQIIYGNLDGKAVSECVSINVDLTFKNGLKLIGGTSLINVNTIENGIKERQILTEHFSANWSVEYKILAWDLNLNYTGNLYSPMRLPLLGYLDNRSKYSPWFSIQNIQLSKGINQQWEMFAGVKNLLNFTPASNSIARPFDPFDKEVHFNAEGDVIPTVNNPNALTFDPDYVYTSNQGIRGFIGLRYKIR